MVYKHKTDDLDALFDAVMALETQEECYDFFVDLCTGPELKAFAQRYKVARMLLAGEVYSTIVEQTGASTATISRVNRSLEDGRDGYKHMLDKLAEKENK